MEMIRALALIAVLFSLAACAPAMSTVDAGNDAATGADTGPVITYWRDIAPMVNGNCVQCHTTDGIGPMSLTTYAQVRPVAGLLSAEVQSGRMPPWQPAREGCRSLQNPRGLTVEQKAMFASWAANGAPEGDPADYVAPPVAEALRPLPPTGDVVVEPVDSYTPVSRSNDDYHCFIMDPQLTTGRDVVGVRVTPGNPAIVHHMILFEVRAESLAELQALDDAEPGPGYTCFGSSGVDTRVRAAPAGSGDLVDFNTQMIVGWAPGGVPGYMPPNTGIRLKAGSRLVMQVHYNLASAASRGMSDRTRVDLYFSPQPVSSQAIWAPQAQTSFRIPAGAAATDPAATVTDIEPQQYNLRFFGAAPHMHMRGRSIRVDLMHTDGTSDCLINIPNWNFHWQQAYWYVSPFRPNTNSAARDSLRLTCTWDNTQANQPIIDGVQSAPHELHWGEGTDQEMCLNFFYVAL